MAAGIELRGAPSVGAKRLVVGTGAVALGGSEVATEEVSVYADLNNSGTVYIGPQQLVNTTDKGFPLPADHGLAGIRVNSLNVIWAIGSAAGQVLWVFYTEPLGPG